MRWWTGAPLLASWLVAGPSLADAADFSVRFGAGQPYRYPSSGDRSPSVAVDDPAFVASIYGLIPGWRDLHLLLGTVYLFELGRYSGPSLDQPPPDITLRTMLLSVGARVPLAPVKSRVMHYFDVAACVGFLRTTVYPWESRSGTGSEESATNTFPGAIVGWTSTVSLHRSLGIELGVAYLFTADFENDDGLPGWAEFGGMRQFLISGGVRFGAF